ncbi:MAG: sulfotransferase [Phycisphaerales bacterium]
MPPTARERKAIAEAQKLLAGARFGEALTHCENALREHPRSTTLMLIRAAALTRSGDARRAIPEIQKILAIEPDRAQAYLELGMALQGEGRLDEAAHAFERAASLAPESPDTAAALGSLRRLQGDHEAAMACVEPLVREGKANSACVLLFAEQAKRLKREREGVKAVREHLDAGKVWPFYVRRLTWALGELHDALGEYDEAFECSRRVNEMDRPPWNPDAFSAACDRMMEAWTRQAVRALPASGVEAELPVFIFGMPRSGTTLTEQIIASHPSAHGGGEISLAHKFAMQIQPEESGGFALLRDLAPLNRGRLARFARGVVKHLSDLDRSAARVTDKAPNSCFHLGLIGAALPKAKLIHCVRHPLDTCLSCYFQDFRDARATAFSRDLTWLGRYYNDYRRVVEHWEEVLETPIHTVVYEKMVEDQLGESRRLLDFLGLEWDDACERFYERKRVARTASEFQVDQPIYTRSVRRHEKYVSHLGPLIEVISPEWLENPAS